METRCFGRTGHLSTIAIFGATAFRQISQMVEDGMYGPVERSASRDHGTNINFCDPDGSLIEFISHEIQL